MAAAEVTSGCHSPDLPLIHDHPGSWLVELHEGRLLVLARIDTHVTQMKLLLAFVQLIKAPKYLPEVTPQPIANFNSPHIHMATVKGPALGKEPDLQEPSLDAARHLKYFVRCLRNRLPGEHYLSTEGNRMYLGYLILNAIDLLTPVHTSLSPSPSTRPPAESRVFTTSEERCRLRKWVLSNRSPAGGFCGTPSLVFRSHEHHLWEDFSTVQGGGQQQQKSEVPVPLQRANLATIASTAFALQTLALLADEAGDNGGYALPAAKAFVGVDRKRTLEWLAKLQREDGSFGEVLRGGPLAWQAEGGDPQSWFVAGGYDMRYCYLAALIRWMLRGDVVNDPSDAAWVEDINVDALVRYIRSCQTFDGGFGENEAHAGYTYCAIGALYLLDRPTDISDQPGHPSKTLRDGIRDMPGLIHWLASRQFAYLEPPGSDGGNEGEYDESVNFYQPPLSSTCAPAADARRVASNGRENKTADTCYTFWVAGALDMMRRGLAAHSPDLAALSTIVACRPARRFLLEKTAHHVVGGFGKNAGDLPDIYHGCLGLAALALLGAMDAELGGPGEPAVRRFDAGLAVSTDTAGKIVRAREGLLERTRAGRAVQEEDETRRRIGSLSLAN